MRIRIDVSYDGGGFHGWAAQPGLRTVQGVLQAALSTVLRLPQVAVTCAGRTDTGVHARGQVVHCDVEEQQLLDGVGRIGREYVAEGRPPSAVVPLLARRLRGVLPGDVVVTDVRPSPDGFDARFSAQWRRYAYRITDGPPDPLTRGFVLAWPRPLDADAMSAAAAGLIGEHDFASFCKRREGATTVRSLLELDWRRDGDLLTGTVRADAFCHHMVRSLVGSLIAVGEGKRDTDWPARVLAQAQRSPSVAVVPAHGLTLEEVGYPADDELAAQAARSRRLREL